MGKLEDNSERQFVGEGNDVLLAEAQKRINEFFFGGRVYSVLDRHTSREIDQKRQLRKKNTGQPS